MAWLIGILGIVFMVCMTIIIGTMLDHKHEMEKEKLEILKKNPELFAKVFKIK